MLQKRCSQRNEREREREIYIYIYTIKSEIFTGTGAFKVMFCVRSLDVMF